MTARLTLSQLIEKCKQVHGDQYDYSQVVYTNAHTRVCIICPHHGQFQMTINNHLHNRRGCPVCHQLESSSDYRDSFIARSNLVHGNKFDYSKVLYLSTLDKVEIVCPQHGSFFQLPSAHLDGKGCQRCYFDTRMSLVVSSTQEFIEKASQIHSFYYDYSPSIFTMISVPLDIICPKHGLFTQRASSHLKGCGCLLCAGSSISKAEISWLDSLKVPEECRQKVIKIDGKSYRVDAYNQTTKTIYEFYGDFWHGNPDLFEATEINKVSQKTFGQLYNDTVNRELVLKRAGYTMITIWERDFHNRKNR
jgi:hypothetical protein